MARVTVEVLSWLRTKLGYPETGKVALSFEVGSGETAGGLLGRLARDHPGFGEHVYDAADGRVYEHVAVLLNGRALELAGGLAAPLGDGDRLVLLPGFAGGGTEFTAETQRTRRPQRRAPMVPPPRPLRSPRLRGSARPAWRVVEMADLSGKVALVTGASKGIGHALAVGLGQAGAAVVASYNTDEAGARDAVERVRAGGGRAVAVQADIRSVRACRGLVERCVAEFGRLDVACCHAGITSWGPFLDYEEPAFDAVVDTNLKGTYFTAQAAARQMIGQGGGGRIVVTSSVTGNQAVQYLSAYGMTKAGLQMLVRNLVLELSSHGITINAVAPGPIVNERNLSDDPEYEAKWASVVPLRRAGWPKDVVGVVLFLASEEASYVTGTTILVDGGWTCYSPTPGLEFVERRGGKGE